MKASFVFYTEILDFEPKHRHPSPADLGVDLVNEGVELQVTVMERDSLFGSVVNICVPKVDDLFKKFFSRGLQTPHTMDSPVHHGPTDHTRGTREFYVTDPDGNTLRYVTPQNNA